MEPYCFAPVQDRSRGSQTPPTPSPFGQAVAEAAERHAAAFEKMQTEQ